MERNTIKICIVGIIFATIGLIVNNIPIFDRVLSTIIAIFCLFITIGSLFKLFAATPTIPKHPKIEIIYCKLCHERIDNELYMLEHLKATNEYWHDKLYKAINESPSGSGKGRIASYLSERRMIQ